MAKRGLLFDPSMSNEIYTLDEVLKSLVKDDVLRQERFKSLVYLASRQHTNSYPRAPKNNRRFYIQVWKDLSKVDLPKDTKVSLSFSLLEKELHDDTSLLSLEEIKDGISSHPKSYFMVSVFAMYCARKANENASTNIQDHILCVGTLLAAYCADYFVISHVAVSSAICFSETHFGKGSDGKSFRNRGVGRVLVAVAQAMYSTLFPTRNISMYCWSFWRDKQCFLKELGFQACEVQSGHLWPLPLQYFIEKYCYMNHGEMSEDSSREAVVLHNAVKGFEMAVENCEELAEKEKHVLFKGQFLLFDTYPKATESLDEFESTKNYFIQSLSSQSPSHVLTPKLNPDVLSMLQCKKASILFLSGAQDISKELKTVTHKNTLVPQVAMDYILLLIMLMHENTICINVNTVAMWYKTSFNHEYQLGGSTDDTTTVIWDSKAAFGEFKIMSSFCNSNTHRMIFPFCYNAHWIIVEWRWLCGKRVFFYADSDFKTTTHVNAANNDLIPANIIWLFANTPMWPLESDAYWIYVPNVQQLEKECGARALLHAMLMVSSSVPHDSLLCLQNVPKKDCKILNKLCRQWVNQILVTKKLLKPTFLKADEAANTFQYTPEWLVEYGSQKCFDLDAYELLTTEVRKGDVEMGLLHVIPEKAAIVTQEESIEVASDQPLNNEDSGEISPDQTFLEKAVVTAIVTLAQSNGTALHRPTSTEDFGEPTSIQTIDNDVHDTVNTNSAKDMEFSLSDNKKGASAENNVPGSKQQTNTEAHEIGNDAGMINGDDNIDIDEFQFDINSVNKSDDITVSDIVNDLDICSLEDPVNNVKDKEDSKEDDSSFSDESIGRAPWVVNYDSELQDSVEVPSPRKRLQQLDRCVNCTKRISDRKYETCKSCSKNLHSRCGVILHPNVQTSGIYCYSCIIGTTRYKFSSLDRQIMASLGISEDKYGKQVQREMSNQVEKMYELNRCLERIQSMRRDVTGPSLYRYYGRTKDEKKFEIPIEVVEELLLYFFKDTLRRINLAPKKEWVPLPENVIEYIVQFGRTFGNNSLFDTLEEVEETEWQYMKFNTWNGRKVSMNYKISMTDLESFHSKSGYCWLSFSNNCFKTQVPFVPTFFYLKWLHTCNIDRDSNHPNEVEGLFKRAKQNAGNWIEIDAGSSRRVGEGNSFRYRDRNLPKSYRLQPYGENSCIFNSLANAMHYINDWRARDMLIASIPSSLSYDSYKTVAASRKKFAAFVVNVKVTGYITAVMDKFDILQNHSIWPTLCILRGSDNSVNHAITVVDNFIFDSNCPYAMQLTRDNLDWCCCSDEISTDVKYVEVMFGYRFSQRKPSPSLLIRGKSKAKLGFKSVIMCFKYKRDYDMVEALEDEIRNITPATDIFATCRCIITNNREGKGYWPVCVKTLDEVIAHKGAQSVHMLLLNVKGTSHYQVVSIVDDIISDGSSRFIDFTLENLYSCICHTPIDDTVRVGIIDVVKGYRFDRHEKKQSKTKRLKCLNK